MADVFISYSRLDHERVKPIVERLGSLGYSVWWDKHLRAGQASIDEIERQLDSARVVLTAWSHNARDSSWVYAEASRGLDAGKFVQVLLDNVQRPAPFDAVQAADLSGGLPEWGRMEDALARVQRGDGETLNTPAPGALATLSAAGAPKLLTLATCAILLAYASAVSATYSGAMTPDQLQIAMTGMLGVAGVCAALTSHRLYLVTRAGG